MDDQKLSKVKKFYFRNHRMPSYREMKRMFGYASPAAVAYVIHKWREKGLIKIEDRHVAPDDQFFRLPLLGVIKAGTPTTEDNYETESISLDQYLVGHPGYTFLLRVSGDSMVDEGIKHGDLVILDKKRPPQEGDVVAALIDGQWTLKYFKKQNGNILLQAANPKYQPIGPKESLELGGVVVSVIRKYY